MKYRAFVNALVRGMIIENGVETVLLPEFKIKKTAAGAAVCAGDAESF